MDTADSLTWLTAAEARALGCLIEKEATTPDTYPLTIAAVRRRMSLMRSSSVGMGWTFMAMPLNLRGPSA